MHAYQSPKGTIAPNGGATAPGPRGLRPPPLPLRSGRFPCYLPSGRSVCKNHGGSFSRSERSGSRLLAGGQLLAVVHGGNPRGSVGARKPRPVFSFRVEDPQAGGGEAAPKPRRAHDFPWGKCSESTYRRKWQNGGMAHFAILRSAEAQVRGGGPSLHEAQLQSAGHAKRRRRADAPQRAFRRAQRGRGHGRIQVEAAGELPQGCCPGGRVPDNGQSRPCKASRKASRTPTSGTR